MSRLGKHFSVMLSKCKHVFSKCSAVLLCLTKNINIILFVIIGVIFECVEYINTLKLNIGQFDIILL